MSRDDLGTIAVVLGLGGLGAAFFLLRSRSGSPRERRPIAMPRGQRFLDISGERILIFGDSLSHPGSDTGPTITDVKDRSLLSSAAPGVVLAALLLTSAPPAAAVRINARVGRSARSFLAGEKSLLADDEAWRPTKVIVMLGTNDIDRGTGASAIAQTKDALRQIRDAYQAMGAEVVAVGPPSFQGGKYAQGAPAVLAAMREVFGADRVLDARPLTVGAGRSSSGVHFTKAGAAQAGKQIARALTR